MKSYTTFLIFFLVFICPQSFATDQLPCNQALTSLAIYSDEDKLSPKQQILPIAMDKTLAEYTGDYDTLVTLIQAELIHSSFFKRIIDYLNSTAPSAMLNFSLGHPNKFHF